MSCVNLTSPSYKDIFHFIKHFRYFKYFKSHYNMFCCFKQLGILTYMVIFLSYWLFFLFLQKGDICPAGHYCPRGSSEPIPCTAGKYCAHAGLKEESGNCSAGFYCSGSSSVSNQQICPAGKYCPEGTGVPHLCPSGTFANGTGNQELADCLNCTAGSYCQTEGLAKETGLCDAKYDISSNISFTARFL